MNNAFEPKQEDFHFSLITDYFNKNDHSGEDVVDDRFCNDIDFDEFFMFADRTLSKVGQQFLYNHLRIIPKGFEHLNVQEQFISRLEVDRKLFIRLNKYLEKLSDHDAYYINTLFQDNLVGMPRWFKIFAPILAISNVLFSFLLLFSLKFLLPLVLFTVINLVIHYWNKRNVMVYINGLTQLIYLKKCANSIDKEKVGEFYSVKRQVRTLSTLDFYLHCFKLDGKLGSDFTMALWGVVELLKIIFLLEPLVFFRTIAMVKKCRNDVQCLFETVGYVDACLSILKLRVGLDEYCFPSFTKQNCFEVDGLYHPLITECVKNDLKLNDESMLLTGSNMSGKTSFIRTVALNALSAYTLNTCFANQFKIPRLMLYSSVRINDNLLDSKSYYLEEVEAIKSIIAQTEKGMSLVLLDELFKGTNTLERVAIGTAVLSEFSKKGNLVFAATHDLELAESLKHKYRICHFCEDVDTNGIVFDYKLKEGVLQKTNAIKVLEFCGFPERIVSEAKLSIDKINSYSHL